MTQLDLFPETLPIRYLTAKECVLLGYCIDEAHAIGVRIPVDCNGNLTKEHPKTRTSVEMQWWNINVRPNNLLGDADC